MLLRTLLLSALALVGTSNAQVIPSEPDGSTVVRAGSNITTTWTADKGGTWTNLTIQLMTGSNLAMVPLETVASGLDGTKTTSFSFVAPAVDPYSKIYFLQFTNGGNPSNVQWTTRFTIASADGTTVPPPQNETIADGSIVGWGIGAIVGGSSSGAAAPPAPGAPSGVLAASSAPVSSVAPSAAAPSEAAPSLAPSVSAAPSASAVVSQAPAVSAAAPSASASKPASAGYRAMPALALVVVAAAGVAALA